MSLLTRFPDSCFREDSNLSWTGVSRELHQTKNLKKYKLPRDIRHNLCLLMKVGNRNMFQPWHRIYLFLPWRSGTPDHDNFFTSKTFSIINDLFLVSMLIFLLTIKAKPFCPPQTFIPFTKTTNKHSNHWAFFLKSTKQQQEHCKILFGSQLLWKRIVI